MKFEVVAAFAMPIEQALEEAGAVLQLSGPDLVRIVAAAACKSAVKHHGTGGLEQLRTSIDEWERRVVFKHPSMGG